jgi:hypothetical protein
MGVTIKQTVLQSSTVSSVNSTFVTTADILPGEDIFIAMGRTLLSTDTAGISNITTSAGAGTFERVATATRASTFDVHIGRLRCTTLIPSGSTITAVARDAVGKRGGVMQVVSGLKATYTAANASSGNAADNTTGATSTGPNGSGTAESASTSGATTAADCFVIGANSVGGTSTVSPGSGFTELGESRTSSGSADRGCQLQYKIVSATGTQTSTATLSATGGWCAVVAAFEIEPDPPAGHTDEFTAASGSAQSLVIPVPRAVAAGNLVVVSFAALLSTGTYSITDSRGNTYVVDDGPNDFGLGVANGYARQGASKLTTGLQAGDSITISMTGGTPSRWAAVAGVFNLPANASFGDVEALETDTDVLTGAPPVTTLRANALIVTSMYLVNTGRTVTPTAGWNMSTKVISTGGSGERAAIQFWRYVVAPTTMMENLASFDSSASVGDISRVFEIPAADLVFKEWNGTSWVTLTAKEKTATVWQTLSTKEL